jgi:5-(carboxyamino)imidazole ribonucleotide synthase
MLAPGATIGIMGGGQLGRMTAMAAARLGYRCLVLTPEPDAPAAQVAASITAAYDDPEALAAFAARADVVTIEFENLPTAPLARLAQRLPVRPSPEVLAVCQDRRREKAALDGIAVPVAPWRAVDGPDALAGALGELGGPSILKTATLGYDGKGQLRLAPGDDPAAAWERLGAGSAVLERVVDFALEVSVITARGLDGAVASYVPVENRHEHHILATTLVPAPIPAALATDAVAGAERIAAALGVVGLLAVEMFVTRDGRLLVNELAPRPHNSGHWTIDACPTSQFEQLVRAICGLPLGAVDRLADARMDNLIGEAVAGWPEVLAEPGARLHLYGKREVRPGRKMGHVTRLTPRR